jgi:predicted phosphodiesterase
MQIAILSDIHGNPIALEAVLRDVASAGGADEYWLLGDFAALGPAPVAALEMVNKLPKMRLVRGNTDRYLCEWQNPLDAAEQMARAPESAAGIAARLAMLCWAQGALAAAGWLDWLAGLELEQRLTLPDGTRVLLVHAAPGTDDGEGIRPTLSEAQIAERVANCGADLIFVGHTHWPLERRVGAVRVVNLGSVSNPWPPDLRASYYLLRAEAQGYALEHRRVDYDWAAVIEQLERVKHPGLEVLRAHFRGERLPPWQQ